ncbi:MAG: arsenate reductase ArsC [Terrimicrobiaceae bacterium]
MANSPPMHPRFRVLFLCTRNADRSILAEFFLRSLGGETFDVSSGGGNPAGEVHPLVLKILPEVFKIDPAGAASKSWHDFDGQHFDFIITVCDDAREACPVFPGEPVTAHWSFPDPERFRDSPEEKYNRYLQTAFQIRRRVELFAGIPLEKLDRLQRELHARAELAPES